MKRLPRRFSPRTSPLMLPLCLFAAVCFGHEVGPTRECQEKDYLCRMSNYAHIVLNKCTPKDPDIHHCLVTEQTKLVEANPDDVAAYYYRGITCIAWEPDRAIADFNKVLQLDRLFEPVYMKLAEAYEMKGDHDWALTFLNRGTELFPAEANFYQYRGYIHLKRRDFDKALADFNKVTMLRPDSDGGFIGRAELYSSRGDLDKAVAEYDRAIDINPRAWRSYYDRGFIYWKRGEKAKAGADCQKAKELKPFERPRRFPTEHVSNDYCSL